MTITGRSIVAQKVGEKLVIVLIAAVLLQSVVCLRILITYDLTF